MHVNEMTREEFDKIPRRKNFCSKEKPFHSLVIIPMEDIHDSDFRLMDFVAVDSHGEPIVRLSGCSDVLHINGIGGYGYWRSGDGVPKTVLPIPWSIDCMKGSGYFRLFYGQTMTCGDALSSFEVYAKPQDKEKLT